MGILRCLAGDTLISTLDGKIPIKDLVGKKPYLYCLNNNGEIRIRRADKVYSSGRRKLFRIFFDNDSWLDCTDDHSIMLSDMKFIQAKHLKPFDSIMAFHKRVLNGRYEVGVTMNPNSYSEHILVAEMMTGKLIKQEDKIRKADDLCIHHIDENSLNNSPNNLLIMTISEHAKIHSENLKEHQIRIAGERKGKKLDDVYDKELVKIWKENRYKFFSLLGFLALLIYIFSSWWMWFYGGSFGCRVMIEFYSFFAILFIDALQFFEKIILRKIFISFVFIMIIICQIQTYQYRYNHIHWSEMNKERYWKVFMRVDLLIRNENPNADLLTK